MKQLLSFLLPVMLLTSAFTAHAQGDDMPPLSEERMREIKAQKTAYLTTKLGLTSEEAQRFWPIYNEYDEARERIRKQMRGLMRRKQEQDKPLTDAEAEQRLIKGLELRQQELDIERNYKDRFVKSIGALRTLELVRAEHDFNREVLRRLRERSEERGGGRPTPKQ